MLKLHPTVIFRVPKFSYNCKLENNWIEIKDAIREASPDFYFLIENMNWQDFVNAEKKIKITVQKYFNRASFRSTPFGSFASVGLSQLTEVKHDKLEISDKQLLHYFKDWKYKAELEFTIEELLCPEIVYFSNTTYYRVQNEIRFIQKVDENFEMTAIDYDPAVCHILDFLIKPKPYATIIEVLGSDFGIDVLNEYLQDMISIQLIITSKQANIIGTDYFTRIRLKQSKNSIRYLIPEVKSLKGGFSKAAFRDIPKLIEILSQITPDGVAADLNDFRIKFFQRYEQAEIPIMEALDPEIGIGYGNLAVSSEMSEIIQLLAGQKNEPSKIARSSETLKNRLYELLIRNEKVIQLEELLPKEKPAIALPNSLSVICSVADNLLFLEHIGGVTATAIPGRFALAVPAIKDLCIEIAGIEQEANPEVLFFDIGYTKEDRVDNINRRPSIYGYQLNILNFDTSEEPLSLTDIFVSIKGNEVVLHSRIHGKRIVPRMASAYNSKRSDLPLFRLLIDIQNQNLKTNLKFSPSAIIPGLPCYPRVQFQNIVVSPASWKLNSAILSEIKVSERAIFLQQHLHLHLPFSCYKVGRADQTLCLNVHAITDTEVLLSLLDKTEVLYLEETHIPTASIINDTNGRPYISQLVFTLYHEEKIFNSVRHPLQKDISLENRQWVPPGKEWLYFELYCSPRKSDVILHEKILPYLNQFRKLIKRWFFIRYGEGGDHIRLRIELSDAKQSMEMVTALSEALESELQSGILSDLKLCTYKKEVHRYSTHLMNDVEQHFYQDSKFVMQMLSTMLGDMAKYKLCLDLFHAVELSELIDGEHFDKILMNVKTSFDAEHALDILMFKEINKIYKALLVERMPSLAKNALQLHANLKSSFIDLLGKCELAQRPKLFADLVHMHVNRLFSQNQRTHETMIYHFAIAERKRRMHQRIRENS